MGETIINHKLADSIHQPADNGSQCQLQRFSTQEKLTVGFPFAVLCMHLHHWQQSGLILWHDLLTSGLQLEPPEGRTFIPLMIC